MEWWSLVIVGVVAAGVGALTLVSGFGLGTILTPVLAVWMPVEVAVAATAVVHLANNLFKVVLVGRLADRGVVLRFGVAALVAAGAGAWALSVISHHNTPVGRYVINLGTWQTREFLITPVGLVVGALIAAFGMLEPWSAFERWRVGRRWLVVGGLLSGFFGGMSGHQGALRTVFLARSGLEPRVMIGTGAVCSTMVDLARVLMYAIGAGFFVGGWSGEMRQAMTGGVWLVVAACIGAFVGSFGGARFIHKVTWRGLRRLLGIMMVVLGVAVIVGIV